MIQERSINGGLEMTTSLLRDLQSRVERVCVLFASRIKKRWGLRSQLLKNSSKIREESCLVRATGLIKRCWGTL